MTGEELRAARRTLGEAWGLGRPLQMAELGRALGLMGSEPGASVRTWERRGPTGPVAAAVAAWLDGAGAGVMPRRPMSEIIDQRQSSDAGQ